MGTRDSRSENDPKGLVAEAYRIEGIGLEECRSIFLDWALSLPAGVEPREAIGRLLALHGAPEHPMTEVLRAGLEAPPSAGRRGGRKARGGARPA